MRPAMGMRWACVGIWTGGVFGNVDLSIERAWGFARRLRRALLGCALLAACNLAVSGAYAQDRDESWVISHILAGKFDELRSLEKLSAQGVPFALHWWGLILERCIFERCDGDAGRELLRSEEHTSELQSL